MYRLASSYPKYGTGPIFGNPAPLSSRGMGACCSSCAHGGECDSHKGLGLFDSGMDFTTWGLPEWGIVALGGYMLFSTVFTTKRAVGAARRIPGNRRQKKAAYHRAIAKRLSSKSGGGLF
jgi:hypothetical protein